MPITRSANVAAIDIPAVLQKDLALLNRPRADNSADEGIVNNGALGNEETGDVGPAVGGGGTYRPIENGTGTGSGSLVERDCRIVAQQQARQYALHGVKIADGGSFFHGENTLASDMVRGKRSERAREECAQRPGGQAGRQTGIEHEKRHCLQSVSRQTTPHPPRLQRQNGHHIV